MAPALAFAMLVVAGSVVLSVQSSVADTPTVDFETGPPIGQPVNDDYAPVASVYWQRADPGFRPYRRAAQVATHSGTVAADIGPDHCYPGEVDDPSACEFVTPSTLARLTEGATAVTLYAGLFSASSGDVTATLTAYDGTDAQVATTTATIGVGITTRISVSSPSANIARFDLLAGGTGGVGAEIGFDDLSLQFPDPSPTPTPTPSPTPTPPQTCSGGSVSPEGTRVSSPAELASLLRNEEFAGTIVVPKDAYWDMRDADGTPLQLLPLRSGVSLVGERGDLGSRPLLFSTYVPAEGQRDGTLFHVIGNDVRIEGLHVRGPWPAAYHKRHYTPYTHGIVVQESAETQTGERVVIADNEFDQWGGGAVVVRGDHSSQLAKWDPAWPHFSPRDVGLVRVEQNYEHHNVMDGGGYGVTLDGDAYVTVEGNVFDYNRHHIAADGRAYQGYVVRYNYVLEGGTKQDGFYNQHFDVHGELPSGYGGYAGTRFVISHNAIRGDQTYYLGTKTRPALMLRGRPERGMFFEDNILVHAALDEAISLKPGKIPRIGFRALARKLNFHATGNQFGLDHSGLIGAGDFDGDGCTDAFVGTGTAWFFSRSATAPWEVLRPSTITKGGVGLADIDNDGTTDVLWHHDADIVFASGGRGDPQDLTSAPVPMKDLRFGDFDGDGLTDIFYTKGGRWNVWYGRDRTWVQTESSSIALKSLLFGEFDDVPGTDVAAVTSGMWAYSSGSTQPWARLNAKLIKTFEGAVAADFDGDGRSDIAFGDRRNWRYSSGGAGSLTKLRGSPASPQTLRSLPVGRFDPGVDRDQLLVPFFKANRLYLWPGLGSGDSFTVRSLQAMR
jgi:hypothetical protein